ALYEFYGLFFQERKNGLLIGTGLAALTYVLASHHWSGPDIGILFLATVVGLTLPLFLRTYQATDGAVTVFGVIYIGIAFSYLLSIRAFHQGEYLLLFILLITWMADTGAYYVGKMFGRHLLAPTISPKKTVEGLIGGLTFAVITAYVTRSWIPADSVGLISSVILGSLLTLAGLAGDLVESAIKRSTGAKDSSRLLPGHGGMLDRIDSLLFTAPTFYYYIRISGIPTVGS
ncbi:MAG TPA: phosphatidate cytidylyltransferase, partial [Nitrospiraceae bacterium]